MKRMIGIVVAAAVVSGVAAVYAGDACCAAGKAKAGATGSCAGMFSGLKLSDEQQAKVDALVKECQGAKCTEESRAKFMAGVKGVLTAEQYTEWQAQCDKAKKSGACPVTGKANPAPKE
jgi:Spy/CpxP family protein refolding chaperone